MPAAETANKPAPTPDVKAAAEPAGRRHVPGWLIALVAAGGGVGYGAGLEKMSFGPPLVMLGLGGMTLALCGMALWRMIDPLTRPEGLLARETRRPQRMRELEREKQAVLKAIKEIELDHQMRKIADGDYREMIERYRTRAMRLISEIEAGDNFRELIERELKDRLAAATAAMSERENEREGEREGEAGAPAAATAPSAVATAAAACAACGAANDDDARFCKKCGASIGKADAAS